MSSKYLLSTFKTVLATSALVLLAPLTHAQPATSPHSDMKGGTHAMSKDTQSGNHVMAGTDMKAMMEDNNSKMMGMKSTGNTDTDFAMMMKIHHQGAITMAEAQLNNGKDAQMRAMAKDIIKAQKKEIAVFDKFLAKRSDGGMKMSSPAMPMKQ